MIAFAKHYQWTCIQWLTNVSERSQPYILVHSVFVPYRVILRFAGRLSFQINLSQFSFDNRIQKFQTYEFSYSQM